MARYLRDSELKAEYDFGKNTSIDFSTLTLGQEKKVWWKCKDCGHSWNTQIYLRAHGSGCPKCRKKEVAEKRQKDKIRNNGSLKDNYPIIAQQWDYEKNGTLTPEDINPTTNKKVWWKCEKGHEWEAAVAKRTLMGRNCPICSNQKIFKGINDLPTINPILAHGWNYDKNQNLDINSFGANSTKKVWWKCEKGHEWEATIASRNHGNGCPVCANRVIIPGENDLATKNPELLQDWNYSKNSFLPTTVSSGSSKKVHWKCHKCQHEWSTPIAERAVRGIGCPECSSHRRTSFAEKAIYYYISKINNNAIENYKTSFLGASELDIFLPDMNIGIEYDGSFYHKNTGRDIKKDNLCEKHGIKLYRIREFGCPKLNSSSICIERNDDNNHSLNKCIELLIGAIFNGIPVKINTEKDRIKIFSLIEYREIQNSLKNNYPSLASEWNYAKNGNLAPENVSIKSGKKVWWLCNKCHNEWEATIASRSQGNGCPYCNNKMIAEGFNDVKTTNPELILDWDYKKNKKITPNNIAAGSGKKIWWKCHTCANEWQATIVSRTSRGNGCPVCGRKKLSEKSTQKYIIAQGSFEEKHKDLLVYWDFEKNIENPSEIPANSHKNIWWTCEKGHSYKRAVANMLKSNACPYCSNRRLLHGYNDLETVAPDLLLDWDYTKNQISPHDLTPNSHKKVYWKCHICGFSYQTPVNNRAAMKRSCPQCSREKQKNSYRNNLIKKRKPITITNPQLMHEWDYEKNILSPAVLTEGSSKKAWWKCKQCGYSWEAKINHRTSGSGCPKCYERNKQRP